MQIRNHMDSVVEGMVKDSLIRNLERWVQYLDASARFGSPLSQDSYRELKELLQKALKRIEENEKNLHSL